MNKETLSDKEMEADNKEQDNGFYWSKDVREAIKKLKEKLLSEEIEYPNTNPSSYDRVSLGEIKLTIKEIFGEELIK